MNSRSLFRHFTTQATFKPTGFAARASETYQKEVLGKETNPRYY